MTWKDRMPPPVRDTFFREYATAREERPVAVDCALGTNPVGAPEGVVKRLGNNLGDATRISAYPSGDDIFRKALSTSWDGAFTPDEVVLGTGSIGLLISLARTFCAPGSTVVGLRPQFPDGPLHFRLAGARYRSVLLKGPDFSIHLDTVASKLTGDESLVYIDRPHNPTGQAVPLEDVGALADACAGKGTLLVVDEAYGDFLPREESSISLGKANVITLRSFAKGWGLAGLRAGYAVVRDTEARQFLSKVAPPFSVNTVAAELAMVALQDNFFLAKARKTITEIKKAVLEQIRETPCVKASYTHPAVPILLVTHSDPAVDLYELLMTQGIRTEAGTCFEGLDASSVRLRVPAPKDLQLFAKLWNKALQ
ncbi:MAG: pyridoxal phosphate-dependent aminotransferase [Thermovirgaceae bacterium]